MGRTQKGKRAHQSSKGATVDAAGAATAPKGAAAPKAPTPVPKATVESWEWKPSEGGYPRTKKNEPASTSEEPSRQSWNSATWWSSQSDKGSAVHSWTSATWESWQSDEGSAVHSWTSATWESWQSDEGSAVHSWTSATWRSWQSDEGSAVHSWSSATCGSWQSDKGSAAQKRPPSETWADEPITPKEPAALAQEAPPQPWQTVQEASVHPASLSVTWAPLYHAPGLPAPYGAPLARGHLTGSGREGVDGAAGCEGADGEGTTEQAAGVDRELVGKRCKYVCFSCQSVVYASGCLIEATDTEGKLDVSRDWEGTLHGRCYTCASPDLYKDKQKSHSEAKLRKMFSKECNRRHRTRRNMNSANHRSRFFNVLCVCFQAQLGRDVSRTKVKKIVKIVCRFLFYTYEEVEADLERYGQVRPHSVLDPVGEDLLEGRVAALQQLTA